VSFPVGRITFFASTPISTKGEEILRGYLNAAVSLHSYDLEAVRPGKPRLRRPQWQNRKCRGPPPKTGVRTTTSDVSKTGSAARLGPEPAGAHGGNPAAALAAAAL
jgi:hypothetical protein